MTIRHFCRMFLLPANRPDGHQAATSPEGSAKTARDDVYRGCHLLLAGRQSLGDGQTKTAMTQELRYSSYQLA